MQLAVLPANGLPARVIPVAPQPVPVLMGKVHASNTTSILGSSISSTGSSTSTARSNTRSAGSSTISERPLLEPSNEEQEKFFATLNQASVAPAVLRIALIYAKDLDP